MAHFDLKKTEQLQELFQTPHAQRDVGWIERFYQVAPDASLTTRDPQVVRGPDDFQYLTLYSPPVAQNFQAYCVASSVDFCTENGLGCTINPNKDEPDWVFTYGDLWGLRATGRFELRRQSSKATRESPPVDRQ